MIVGAHDLSWKVAEYVETHSHSICVFVDSNLEAVEQTRRRGFRAEKGNALETDWLQHEDWPLFKHVLAVTDNADLNAKVCEKWAAHVKRSALHMWAPARLQHEAGFAQILWPQLKRPSEASYELRNKIALMSHKPLSLPAAMAENASICLVHGSKKNIVFGGDPETTVANVPALYYQEHDFNLQRCLAKRPSICLDGSPDGDIFSTLIHAIGEIASDLDIDLESVEIDVRTKEREFPTLIAPGVIVPHAHLINISEPACFLVRFAPDYRSEFYGDEPIRLAVVLLSPSDFPELHLIILGEIAKIFSIPANIEQLAAAKSPRDLDAILAGIE